MSFYGCHCVKSSRHGHHCWRRREKYFHLSFKTIPTHNDCYCKVYWCSHHHDFEGTPATSGSPIDMHYTRGGSEPLVSSRDFFTLAAIVRRLKECEREKKCGRKQSVSFVLGNKSLEWMWAHEALAVSSSSNSSNTRLTAKDASGARVRMREPARADAWPRKAR